MLTKREILEQLAEKGHCTGIPCSECSYAEICGVYNKPMIKTRLQKIGAMALLRMFPEKREFDINNVLTRVTVDKAKVGMKGYIIKDKGKDIYYRGSVTGWRFGGFYDAKIYKSYKWALKALQHIKRRGNKFSIYKVDVSIICEVKEEDK